MRASVAAVLLLLPLVEAGCAEKFVDFKVHRLLGLRVTKIDRVGFDTLVRCELENANPVAAEIEDVVFRASTGEHLIGRGTLRGPFPVAARSRFELELPLRVAYVDLPADFPKRVERGELPLVTEAGLRAHTKVGTYEMKLVSTGSMRIAESLPVVVQGPFQGDAVRVQAIHLGGLELRRMRLRIRFVARNPFAFPVHVRRGELKLDVNGRFFGEGKLGEPLLVPARGSRASEIEVAATHGAVASVALSWLGEEPSFRLQGALWIDPIGGVTRVPIDVRADSSVFSRDSGEREE
jgi:LEA14-like dessication related protein